ncbi:ABC transporter ATP-binding protein [Saccharothrix variisporea]|uniref:Macrolide transport system ATP-binding/permease protein n=1 Tax=Saccharothrix variisporea TaxID=543527 RepID=A0A495XNS1_9PSEU|nr:ATP-binding cassette domain-containing protein [Saccharothrix variisporea]RKT74113.1 macrolide transport system ATP-binding/permease protein [Saccharothrix variisporea]
MAEAVLRLREVGVTYRTPAGSVTAVSDVSLDVPAGGITVLAGPSGSGKSTLLRVLSLVERPTLGAVELRGRGTTRLSSRARRALRRTEIALVFQNPGDNLIGHLDVGDNLRAAAAAAGRSCSVDELLDQFGLPGTARWKVAALSGGQQQRLAFACALARGASVVLADEPTSQLDTGSADLVLDTLRDLAARGVPVVVASHDPRLIALADTRYDLRNGALAA